MASSLPYRAQASKIGMVAFERSFQSKVWDHWPPMERPEIITDHAIRFIEEFK